MFGIRRWLFAGTAVALAATSSQVAAQTTAAGELDEVVVTAQRRNENLQEVPIAVSVVAPQQLKGSNDLRQIADLVPGLVINFNLNSPMSFLRGVGQNSGTYGNENPLAIYVDGVYLFSPVGSAFTLPSVERIEVLKGPQGTLFGRNATAGVLQIVTKDPSHETSGDMSVGYGNYRTYEGRFYGTTALSETLAANLTLHGKRRDKGFLTNLYTGEDTFKSTNYGVQSKLLWTPSDKTSLLFNVLYDYLEGPAGLVANILPGAVARNGTVFAGFGKIWMPIPANRRNEMVLTSAKISHDFNWGTMSLLSAYNWLEHRSDFIQTGFGPNPAGTVTSHGFLKDKTYSTELQVNSPNGSNIEWIGGLFFINDEGHLPANVLSLTSLSTWNTLIHFDIRMKTTSYAAYSQVTVPVFSPATKLTIGGRITHDKVESPTRFWIGGTAPTLSSNWNPAGSTYCGLMGQIGAPPPCPQPTAAALARGDVPYAAELEVTKPTWRLALAHELVPDVNAYASYNRGYRVGAFNTTDRLNPPTLPEVVDAFEIGVKSELLDRRLRLNATAFWTDIQNMQSKVAGTNPPAQILSNAGKARSKGIDFDLTFAATSALTLRSGFEWIPYAKYVNYPRGTQTINNPYPFGFTGGVANVPPGCLGPVTGATATPGGISLVTCDFAGRRMQRTPKFAGNVGATYRMELANNAAVIFDATHSYNSGFNFYESGLTKQKPYHNLRATVQYVAPDDRYYVTVWGTNLTNARIDSLVNEYNSGVAYFPGDPRFYGVTVGAKF
jgi:iron complex outermembrane receptor protein